MNKKAGLQLSTNFIVMFILAIMAFGLGITIIYNIVQEMDDLSKGIDEQTQQEIERLLARGGQVVLPFSSIDMGRDETKALGLGIKNTNPDEEDFLIQVRCAARYGHDGEEECTSIEDCNDDASECNNFILLSGERSGTDTWKRNIGLRENKVEDIFITTERDTPQGRYTFRVDVKIDDGSDTPYGTPRQFYVNVY